MRLIDELDELHTHYAGKVEEAVASDDLAAAQGFAQAYEDEAVQLMAERENLTHLLPLPPFGTRESARRRVIRRLGIGRAA